MNGMSIEDKLLTKSSFKIALECPREFVDFSFPNQHANYGYGKAVLLILDFFN